MFFGLDRNFLLAKLSGFFQAKTSFGEGQGKVEKLLVKLLAWKT